MRRSVWNRFGCMLIVLSMLAGCLGAAPRRSLAAEAADAPVQEAAEQESGTAEETAPPAAVIPPEDQRAEEKEADAAPGDESGSHSVEDTAGAAAGEDKAAAGEQNVPADSMDAQNGETGAAGQASGQDGAKTGETAQDSGQGGAKAGETAQDPNQGGTTSGETAQDPNQSGTTSGETAQDPGQGGTGAGDTEKLPEDGAEVSGDAENTGGSKDPAEEKEQASDEEQKEGEILPEDGEEKEKQEEQEKEKKEEKKEEEIREEEQETEDTDEEVTAFDEEGPASLEEGRVRYGDHLYEIRDGRVYRDDVLMADAGSDLDRLVVAGDILYAVNADTEEWIEVDRSMAPVSEEDTEENNVPLHSHAIAHPENESKVYRFARLKLSVNMAAACGILANIYAESSFDPHASCIDTNGLTSYGICQWNGGRFTKLKNYCENRGLDYTTLEGQLDYLAYELRTSERGAFMTVKSVPDTAEGAWEAGYNWARNFERCAARFHQGRADYAKEHYWLKAPEWTLEGEEEDGNAEPETIDWGDVLPEDIPENGILPRGIWVSGVEDFLYDGQEKTQRFRVYYGNHLAEEGVEYEASYKNNVNAYSLRPGDPGFWAMKAPRVVVSFKGEYSGSRAFYFTISPADITEGKTEELLCVYNGEKQAPVPRLNLRGRILKYGRDFTVSEYAENAEAGFSGRADRDVTEKITLKGIGNYTGELEQEIRILAEKDGKGRTRIPMEELVIGKLSPVRYTGSPVRPEVNVYYPGKQLTLRKGGDYTVEYLANRNAGTAYALVKGLADEGKNKRLSFVGTIRIPFVIEGEDIAEAAVSGISEEGYPYTGRPVYPDGLTLTTPAGERLQEGEDYIVKLKRSADAGNTEAMIVGRGGFTGRMTVQYRITPRDIADALVNDGGTLAAPYAKGGVRPVTRLRLEGRLLEEGTDYSVSAKNHTALYEDPEFAGENAPELTITGKGNYSGELVLRYLILQKDFRRVDISADDAVWSGSRETLFSAPLLRDSVSGRALEEGVDYEAPAYFVVEQGEEGEELIPLEEYEDPAPGTVIRVTAAGRGAYSSDPISADYTVLPGELEDPAFLPGKEEEGLLFE